MVGVPERAAGGDGGHTVEGEAGGAGVAAGAFEGGEDGDGVGSADGADATVAGEDLVAEIAGVGAEAMLMDAVIRTKRAAAFGEDFEVAPAAEGEVIGAAREEGWVGAAAGKGAGDHGAFRICTEAECWE